VSWGEWEHFPAKEMNTARDMCDFENKGGDESTPAFWEKKSQGRLREEGDQLTGCCRRMMKKMGEKKKRSAIAAKNRRNAAGEQGP